MKLLIIGLLSMAIFRSCSERLTLQQKIVKRHTLDSLHKTGYTIRIKGDSIYLYKRNIPSLSH